MPTTKPDFSDPASVVQAFIHQMYCWEMLAASLADSAEARFREDDPSTMHPEELQMREPVLQIPHAIVRIYLTPRKRADTPSGSYSIPPEYNPRLEKVKRVIPKSKSQVVVETYRKALYLGGVREYVVKKQGDKWLIDSVTVTLGTQKMRNVLV
jgi:hypothetical protein